MACAYPIRAYKILGKKTNNGKQLITLNSKGLEHTAHLIISLPCGRCKLCRTAKAREWALRCVHESRMWKNNCFITLTYNDENVKRSLNKTDFQKFMKRLRKAYRGIDLEFRNGKPEYPIRYYHCGEYTESDRPHHHACLFNFDFDDRELYTVRKGVPLYTSQKLQDVWQNGYSTIGDVTPESAAYVAKYIQKKMTGELGKEWYKRVDLRTGEIYELLPEFSTMSRRPGIGKNWFVKYGLSDLYNKDFTTCNGKKFKAPAYYDKLYDTIDSEALNKLKYKREITRAKRKENDTLVKLRTKLQIVENRLSKQERTYENGTRNVFDL